MIFRKTTSKVESWTADSNSRGCNELAIRSTFIKSKESKVFFEQGGGWWDTFDICVSSDVFCAAPSGDALVGQSYSQCFFRDVNFFNRQIIVKYYKEPKYPKPEFFCLLSTSTVKLENNLKKR